MTIELLPGIEGTVSVPISEIMYLWDAGFPGAEVLQNNRALDRSHVRRLSESHGRWPPIELVHFRDNDRLIGNYQPLEAYALVDGRHRLAAATKMKYTHIRSNVETYISLEEVVQTALLANAQHGIDSSPRLRSAHALWMWKNHGDTMTIEDIARIAGVIPRTLKDAIKREQNKHDEVEEEEEEELPPLAQFSHVLFTSLTKLNTMSEALGILYEVEERDEVAKALRALVDIMPIGDRGDMVAFIRTIRKILEVSRQ